MHAVKLGGHGVDGHTAKECAAGFSYFTFYQLIGLLMNLFPGKAEEQNAQKIFFNQTL